MESNQSNLEEEIKYYIKRWDSLSKWNHVGIYTLGTTSIIGGMFVSVFIGSDIIIPIYLKIISFISTAAIAVLSSFDMVNNRNKYRNAWRLLNAKYLLYRANAITLDELILWYEASEKIIGDLHFSEKFTELSQKKDLKKN